MEQHTSAKLGAAPWVSLARRVWGGQAPAEPGKSAPPMARSSMLAAPWTGFWRGLAQGLIGKFVPRRLDVADEGGHPLPWRAAARTRRRVLLALIALSSALTTYVFEQALQPMPGDVLQWARIGLFALLFAWIGAGFWTAVMGFWVLVFGDRHALRYKDYADQPIAEDARTAIIMPICNEHVSTVFAGLRATCESLAATGQAGLFDIFILSDSNDPDARTAELAAWAQLRADLGEQGAHVFYRWRQRRTKRKAGNVADFCRRWGRAYRYMVVLDADSVMSGECLLSMVRMMEGNSRAGIIQTAPQASGLDTLHARAQQFAARVTGGVFTAGMQYWQLGESHYWGHNAIIRVMPFINHCALAPINGRDIMSHDFVEAALMRRAGYQVWVAHDLPGSYEQQPPNLVAELQRDRRWCQGNLQNAQLIAEPGLHGVHRAMLLTGAMAYLSAPLWLLFLVMGAAAWLIPEESALDSASSTLLWLWCSVMAVLMVPRVLGAAAIVMKGEQSQYGGLWGLVKGTVLEALLSAFQAPIRMVAHTLFVVAALTGLRIEWKSPPREANALPWRDAVAQFGMMSVIAGAATVAALFIDARSAVWMLPVIMPIALAVPVTVLTSKVEWGRRLRAHHTLVIPEESSVPAVLRRAEACVADVPTPAWHEVLGDTGLREVVRHALGRRDTSRGLRGQHRRQYVRALPAGKVLESMAAESRMRVLSEPYFLTQMQLRASTLGLVTPPLSEAPAGHYQMRSALAGSGMVPVRVPLAAGRHMVGVPSFKVTMQ
ncbi:MAG: glucans biosynthesis glucosyltransferase MdoH [Rhodocyclaceae bacterium]